MGRFPYPFDNTGVTVELREIVESGVDVWKFEYPSFYTGEEKKAFEQKVLDHYWLRQIGQETVGRWLHYFRTRMREIMPYYIQLYESQALMESLDDPFGNVDITETFEETTTGTATSEDSANTTTSTETTHVANNGNTRRFSNTPQGNLDNLNNYLTEATVDDITADEADTAEISGDSASTGRTDTEGTTRHTLTRKGNQGVNTYAHDMKELRETFLNIDLMIINELKDLFLQVY